MELFFDTETTGLVLHKEPATDPRQPHVIQLAAILSDENTIYAQLSTIINPSDIASVWGVQAGAQAVHGISDELIRKTGLLANNAYRAFAGMADKADTLVCHNVPFDKKLVMAAFHRLGWEHAVIAAEKANYYCTMDKSTNLLKLPGKFPGKFKWPKLSELHRFLFDEDFEGAHDALEDVKATRRCYYELKRRGI